MSNPCIVYQRVKEEVPKFQQQYYGLTVYVTHYFKKDKTVVDVFDGSCILSFLEATELEAKMKHSHPNMKVVTLKELITNNSHVLTEILT